MAQKRPFEGADTDDDGPEDKRQRMSLQSVVLEAVRTNARQKFWVALEPMLRQVVRQEIERVISKYFSPAMPSSRLSSKRLQGLGSTALLLCFQNKLALPLYTGRRVEGENGNPIQVSLQDAVTGQMVSLDDDSSINVDIVVLEGDFTSDEAEDWTYEDFESHVVKERDGKRPLLTGDVTVSLQKGKGILGELIFTDNSSWIRSRKFRLGLRVAKGMYKGVRVREAITEAFFVKDHRGQLYKKHYPPTLNDDVWRLEKIGKDGAYHKRLLDFHVSTVKDFLVMYATGPSRLREIFGATMSTKTWDSIIEHAKTTILNDTKHVYYPNENRMIGVMLNTIYQPLGILRNGLYVPVTSLSDTEQVYMDRLVQEAHKNLSGVCKVPSRGHSDELEIVGGSEKDHLTQHVPPCTELLEKQQLHYQRTPFSVPENSSAAPPSTAGARNMQHNDSWECAPGTGLIKSLDTNAFFSGTLESLFIHGDHLQKAGEPMYEDAELGQSNWQYVDDHYHGRAFRSWGNDEFSVLSGPSTDPISNISIPEGDKNPFSSRRAAQNPALVENYLNRRAYMYWLKFKAVWKFVFFAKKSLASRQSFQNKQLK